MNYDHLSLPMPLPFREQECISIAVNLLWRPFLSVDERDIFSYLLEHSVMSGRHTLDVTFAQMAVGKRAPEGSEWVWDLPPVSMPKPTFYRVIARLKARGLVSTTQITGRRTSYMCNLDWHPAPNVMSGLDMILFDRARAAA